ncbi:MAG: helix-turn-helix domain-containing protein [Patescibacteria group bacterium]
MQIKNEALLKKLEKSGLSDKEALVYTALLELGGAYPSKIALYAGLNRSTVYMLLLHMSVKGLVSEIEKKNKLFYQIESPTKLVRYAKSKMSIIQEEIEHAQTLLPEVEGLFVGINKPRVTYFENIEGILQIYESHISVSKPYEMLAWANASGLEGLLPEKFFTQYRKSKEQKGITTRGIIPDTQSDRTFTDRTYENYKKEIIPKMRYITADKFPFKAEITIFGERSVSIVNLGKEKLTGVIIEDETIHGLMKMIFELSWKGAEETN